MKTINLNTNWIEKIDRLLHKLGFVVEYEVQTTDTNDDWRSWNNGFATLESALKHVRYCKQHGTKWNPYMNASKVKFRVERRVSWARYYTTDENN